MELLHEEQDFHLSFEIQMGALWGNLLTKLKHLRVKHQAVSPHLLETVEESREGKHRDVRFVLPDKYLFFNNAVENTKYSPLSLLCRPHLCRAKQSGGRNYWIYNVSS